MVLKMLGDGGEGRKQYSLALEMFWRVIRRAELREPAMAALAANLWLLAQKLQDSNNKFAVS